jgi:predicted transcriptional regulator
MVANSERAGNEITILRTDKDKRQAPFVYVSPSRTLLELSLWFSGLQVCHIPVIDERARVIGVITPHDVLDVIDRSRTDLVKSLLSIRVSEVVHPAPLLSLDDPVDEVVLRVLDDQCKCGVMLDSNGQPVAIISCYDVLKLVLGVEGFSESLAEIPASAITSKVKVLPFETTVRQTITALVSYSGEPLVVEQTDFAVTSRSLLSAILSPKAIPKLLRGDEEVLDSYLVYENDALVRVPVISNGRSLVEVIGLLADAKAEILRVENDGYVTVRNLIEFIRNRLRALANAQDS